VLVLLVLSAVLSWAIRGTSKVRSPCGCTLHCVVSIVCIGTELLHFHDCLRFIRFDRAHPQNARRAYFWSCAPGVFWVQSRTHTSIWLRIFFLWIARWHKVLVWHNVLFFFFNLSSKGLQSSNAVDSVVVALVVFSAVWVPLHEPCDYRNTRHEAYQASRLEHR